MSTADELKAEMEYAAHVLRYGGINHPHHEEKKVDTHAHHHAQTGDHGHGHGGYGDSNPQAEALKQALADAKAGFDKLVMDARDEYSTAIGDENEDSLNRRDDLNAELAGAASEALRALRDGLDAEVAQL